MEPFEEKTEQKSPKKAKKEKKEVDDDDDCKSCEENDCDDDDDDDADEDYELGEDEYDEDYDDDEDSSDDVSAEAGLDTVKRLVELRAFLERGVKPVEAKLRYQMEKVIGRSVDSETKAQKQAVGGRNRKARDSDDNSNFSDPDSDSEDEAGAIKIPTLDPDSLDARKPKPPTHVPDTIEELSFRPNPRALARPSSTHASTATDAELTKSDGIYRPPRISATSMPSAPHEASKTEKRARPTRLHELDDYITSELSSAPMAVPSIGATNTITAGGRNHVTAQERRKAQERTTYEESNFVRLPAPSKKDAAKARRMNKAEEYGGEDWRGFAVDLDRITGRAERVAKGSRVLENSRKRKGEGGDGAGGGGGRAKVVGKFSKMVGREQKRRRKD